ncbi:MAG: N-acyl homoserine lactonase family protein [Acidimicrobiales bacterium]
MADVAVQRVDFGYFVRPAEETGTGAARAEPCLGYLVQHSEGLLLVDTGMGSDPEVDAYYQPLRYQLEDAVAGAGATLDDIAYVVNCHLHFDHCGGNASLPGRPIFTQRVELEIARREEGYTLPELVDAPGLTYEILDGEAEILQGVFVIPTPGHTAGHQSVAVRRADGTVVVAGQSHNTAAAYGSDVLGRQAVQEHRLTGAVPVPEWIDRLQQFDPARVVFAHDRAVWEP